ncbi:MAG: acyltransferase [Terracidiphilus sp.]
MLLERIRRITRDGRFIPEIDGLRFVAIASVFLFHLSLELQLRSGRIIPIEPRYAGLFRIIGNGDSGVSLFFVVSGFVLALPFARHFFARAQPVSLRKYFIRRLTRLEPPYLLSILLFVFLLSVYTRHITADVLAHAVATMLYLHRLVYGERTFINPVSWSLEIEVQFYIMAPVLMQLYRLRSKLLRRAMFALLILAIGAVQFTIADSPRASESILFYIQFFLMGLLIADVYIVDGDRIRPSLLWDVAGLLGLGLTFGMARTYATLHIVMPWTMALLFLAALRGVGLRRFFANPWIAAIGGMCYSIYLMHFQMIAVLFKVTRRCILPHGDLLADLGIQLLVTGIPVMLISLAFYLLIERPCMDPNWPSRFWHWITGRSPAEADAFDSEGISA